MKFSCDKYELQNACTIASRACAAKSPIPALEGLLIRADSSISVTGYDMKKAIYTKIDADIEERGAIVLSARLFGEMIRKLPDGIVFISTDERENVHVRCGKSDFNFIGIRADDFPEVPEIDEINNISLPQKTLSSMIDQTIFAIADNDIRPIYTGTLFEISGNELTLVSVDGYRLAKRSEIIDNGHMENCTFVVPGSALNDVNRICSEEGDVSVSVGAKHIAFKLGETVVITRRLEGEFLNYRKSIPENFRYVIGIDRSEFMATIDRVAIIISEKNNNPLRLIFGDGQINCNCMTPVGKAEDECFCEGSGDGLEIGFNDRYLRDALKASGKDKLLICLNTSASPAIIKSADGEGNFTFMILPVRLRAGE